MKADFIYNCNDTMKLLGNQTSPMFFNDDVRKTVHEIFDAYNKHATILFTDDVLMMMSDIFNLGVIYGKRDLRAKRGGGNIITSWVHIATRHYSKFQIHVLNHWIKIGQ